MNQSTGPQYPTPGYPESHEDLQRWVDQLDAEAAELELVSFTADDARRLGMILVALAEARVLPVAIDITRGMQVLFHVAMPGATADNDDWVRRKVRTVVRHGEPSLLVGMRPRLRGKRIEDDPWFDERRYAAHGGCVPVCVRGAGMVATATVSGLPQVDDHRLVVEALRALRAEQRA